MANSIIGTKAGKANRTSGGWAKEDDPIYSKGWAIAPVVSARQQAKASKSSNQDKRKD